MLFQSANCVLALETDAPLRAYDGAAHASFSLSQGESATFVLEHAVGPYEPHGHSAQQIRELSEATGTSCRPIAPVAPSHEHSHRPNLQPNRPDLLCDASGTPRWPAGDPSCADCRGAGAFRSEPSRDLLGRVVLVAKTMERAGCAETPPSAPVGRRRC